ncbi:hypothetical protein Tco_0896271 [Tanacetum coccineum]
MTKEKQQRLKCILEIIPDEEEVKIDAIPLAVKSPYIVDWKIHKEGRKSYYQIIRADGKSQMYMIFRYMLKSFDREDLETLYKLVKAKYKSIRPVEDLDLVLWNDLKTMFEPHVEDAVWRNQQDYKMLSWKLYDSYGGRIVRIKSLLDAVRITATQVYVNTASKDLIKFCIIFNIQAKIDADHQLTERLQAQEQEELYDAEKATLFQQLLEKRRKHFAAKRSEEKRNKPPKKLNRER